MANPQNPGTFDYWITDRLTFATLPPKTGDTGTFDQWLTDRVTFADYVEAAAVTAGIPVFSLDGIHSSVFGGKVIR